MKRFKILVPIDFTVETDTAIEAAIQLSTQFQAKSAGFLLGRRDRPFSRDLLYGKRNGAFYSICAATYG